MTIQPWTRALPVFLLAIVASANCSFGQFVYAVSSGNQVSASAVDANTGALTPAPGSPFATGTAPAAVAVDSASRFVFVANAGSNDVSAYTIDAATGALRAAPHSPFAAGVTPSALAIDSSGAFVYIANAGSSDISAYQIDAATGDLIAVPGSPFAAASSPSAMAVAGKFLYVANSGSGGVSAYALDGSGALTPVAGSPFPSGRNVESIGADPAGKFVYAVTEDSGSHSLAAFRIDSASGALAQVAGSPFELAGRSAALAGRFVYVSNGDEISAYTIDANTGTPAQLAGSRSAGRLRSGLVIDRAGKFAYTAGDSGDDVLVYRLDTPTGALRAVSSSAVLRRSNSSVSTAKIAVAGPAPSGTALVTAFTGVTLRNNFTGGFGMQFTVGATALNVTALGRIYIAGNSMSHIVKLVNVSDGTDVPGGAVTIPLPLGNAGDYAYVALPSPITLAANTSYYLISSETSGGDQFFDLGPVTTTAVVSADGAVIFWPSNGFFRVGPANGTYVPVNLLYTLPGSPPTVAITAPAPGTTVSGNNVTLSASATASPGLTIASVQFQVDNGPVGAPVTTAPYTFTLDSTKLANGPHTVSAVATDSSGGSTTSGTVGITVNNNPTVAITAPGPGVTVSGNSVTLSATATPAPGLTITQVQFKVDNAALGVPLTTSPYSTTFDSTKLSNGTHTLTAVATDSAMNSSTSAPVNITVNNTTTTVAITTPMAGAVVSGPLPITATATAGTGLTIASVQFKIDNVSQGPPITTSPYTITVDTTTLSNGPHSIVAVATDSANVPATSAPVSIMVSNGAPPPAGTALVSGFTAGAPRNNFTGGFGMQFTVGASPLNVIALGRVYIAGNAMSHVVKLVNVSDGSDVPGGSVTISLPSGAPGQFVYASLASPVTLNANTSYYLISLEVNAGDQFYDLGPVTTSGAVSVDGGIVFWPGNGFIRVGPANESYGPVNLLYTTPGTPPSVTITTPSPGLTVSGNNLTVSASASAANGATITSVQFQVDNNNVGAPVTNTPYSIVLDTTTLSNGPHTLTAVATDSNNLSNKSAVVNITVNNNPTVNVTAPSAGATVSGKNVALSATATATTGLTIANVQFQIDNTNVGAPVTSSPYGIIVDSTTLSNGPHSVTAIATDSGGHSGTSPAINFSVNNSSTSVVISAPAPGATVSGSNVTVSATATPGLGLTIAKVQFLVDNMSFGAPVTTSPYNITLDTTTLANGPHTVAASATDSANNTVTSSPVSITVSNAGPPPAGAPLITGFTAGAPRNNFTGGFGLQFTVGAVPLTVSALGRIYVPGNTQSHLVKLINVSDGSDVPGGAVTITFPSGTPGQITYAGLASPVTLNANTSYYLISMEVSGGDQFYDLGPVTASDAVGVDGGIVFWPGNGFIRVGPANESYGPVNLLYTQ